MKGVKFLLLYLLLFNAGFSQNSRLTVDIEAAADLCSNIRSSVLIIPLIHNSENEIVALKEAVRKYWKVSPYKFISKEEYDKIRDMEKKGPGKMYLIKETYERLKYIRKDWAYTKYFLTTEPGGVEVLDAPFIEFKLPVKSEHGEVKEVDYSFIYSLMLKQMNFDVELMCSRGEYDNIKRKSLIKARFDRSLRSYSSKELILSKVELENYIMNMYDDEKTYYDPSRFLRYLSKKTKMDISHIKYVSDDEIKKAVLENDENKLIYTGFTIYNAANGKMLRRIDPNRSRRKANTVVTLMVSTAIIAASIYIFRS